MKLAWIVYDYEDDPYPVILFIEPNHNGYWKVVPIVYAEN